MAKKIVLDGGKTYTSGSKELQADGIEICTGATYTPEDNGHSGRMSRTIKNVIRTMLLHSGAPENLRAECLYAICDAHNRLVRVERLEKPQELLTTEKPTVAPVCTFGWKVWTRVPGKRRKYLEAKALPGI